MPPLWPIITIDHPKPKPTLKYNVSVTRDFVSILKSIRCVRCGEKCTTNPIPPKPEWPNHIRTAHCGHYIHEKCEETGKRSTDQYSCSQKVGQDFPTECQLIGGEAPKPFYEGASLGEFYTSIKAPGYRCDDCQLLHPKLNSVRCVDPNFGKTYLCVWCVTRNEPNLKESIWKICVIPAFYDPTTNNDRKLALDSIDPNCVNYVKLLILQCCVCAVHLLDINCPSKSTQKLSQLPCGHMRHEHCYTDSSEESICCNICGTDNPDKPEDGLDKRPSHLKEYVNLCSDTAKDWSTERECESYPCDTCKKNHPMDNFANYKNKPVCVWCEVDERTGRTH